MPADDLEPLALPPGLDPPQYVHPTSKAMAKPSGYKPTHRLADQLWMRTRKRKPNGEYHGQCLSATLVAI
eukprot:243549-Amphidinium_carterae.2